MKILCKNKHWKINKEYDIDKILYLLIGRSNFIDNKTYFYYYVQWLNKTGLYHRDYDLPAFISISNVYWYKVQWYKNNELHRENNKPAAIWADSSQIYYINNKIIKEEK